VFISFVGVNGYFYKELIAGSFMKKMTGYVVSIVGIVVMALGFQMIDFGWEILNLVPLNYVAGAGLVLVGIGVLISLKGEKGKVSSGKDEVPIYEGVGKSRRIVGYRTV